MLKDTRKEHWKTITKVQWLANTDNVCSLNQPAYKTKTEKKTPQITLCQEKEEGGNRDKSMKRIHRDRQNNTITREAINGEQAVKFKNSHTTKKDIYSIWINLAQIRLISGMGFVNPSWNLLSKLFFSLTLVLRSLRSDVYAWTPWWIYTITKRTAEQFIFPEESIQHHKHLLFHFFPVCTGRVLTLCTDAPRLASTERTSISTLRL